MRLSRSVQRVTLREQLALRRFGFSPYGQQPSGPKESAGNKNGSGETESIRSSLG